MGKRRKKRETLVYVSSFLLIIACLDFVFLFPALPPSLPPSFSGPAPTARKPSQRRGGKGGGEGLVSLPSGDEGASEDDAESTGSEDSEESD